MRTDAMQTSLRNLNCRGYTLLEVLIALLVFSLGLFGLAAILLTSMKVNGAAAQRTQATFLAQSLVERMRANTIGVWLGAYDGTWPSAPAASCNPTNAGCSPADIAAHDVSIWIDAAQQFLPEISATLHCDQHVAVAPSDLAVQPPYQGTCTLRMRWAETVPQGTVDTTGANATGFQTFSWIFIP